MQSETHGFPRKPPVFSLAEDEKKTFKAVFSRYSPGKITGEQARKILQTLDEAGLPGMGAMIVLREAGMDPADVWSVAHDGQIFPLLRKVQLKKLAPDE